MRLTLVCGPFGSGTSAVADLTARLGAIGFGPYYQPADPLTADSHELVAFRDFAAERYLGANADADGRKRRRGGAPSFPRAHRPPGIRRLRRKNRGADLPQASAGDADHSAGLRGVRDAADLSDPPGARYRTSRQRRQWGAQYGAKGASIIYSHMFTR
jgi:hypothetical protein